ncbi:hypothetical protein [Mesorhizobium sp. B2-4-17]|uniref:hypothetical protein n=1 Tax=Mesorhizobium sp. B2-4-17 TaxID=2589932 RepID=UPI00112D5C4E|nr:hypothetical protein [Mesorhizobium sp. B2-4-17]TPK69901.1 hypothetical protein FJ548_29675 [Mesorhizobium sp. B2-4-17]
MNIIDIERTLEVSPSIDERAVDHHAERAVGNVKPEPDLEHMALSGAMKAAREEAHALANLAHAVFADKTQAPAVAALQVAQAAQKVGARVAAKLDAAHAKVSATIAGIEKATFAPAVESKFEIEIRAALKAMTQAKRTKELAARFDANDMTTLAAVLSAPSLLTGMTAAELDALRHRYREKHFPTEMKRLDRLVKMRAAAETGGKAFLALVQKASDTKFADGAIAARTKRESALAAHQQGA